jgi:outer membrane protein assembly factor BamB
MTTKYILMLLVSIGLVFGMLPTASADDWPTYQQNNYNNGVISESVNTTPQQVWQHDPGSGGLVGWETSPIIANGIVYSMFYNGNVYAYNLTDGYEVWNNTEIAGNGFNENCTPAYDKDNNQLYVAISSGNSSGVYALDGNNGSVVWSNTNRTYFPVGSQFVSAIRYENGSIYVLSNDYSNVTYGNLTCLNASTGEVRMSNGFWSWFLGLFVSRNYEVVGDADGNIRILDRDGNVVHQVNPGKGAILSITYRNGYLIIVTAQGTVMYRYNPATGEISGDPIFVDTSTKRCYSAPAATNDHIYVTDLTGNLTCYDHNLTYIDSVNFGYPITSPPVVTTGLENDHVYITVNGPSANGSGKCCVFENGTFMYSTSFGPSSNTTQGVAIVDGYLVFGNSNGELTCFKADYIPPVGYTTIWNGTVNLGSFTFYASNYPYNGYTYSWMSDVGAFYTASQSGNGNFSYFVNDSWYPYYGSFYVESIAGISNDDYNYLAWFMYINGTYCDYGLGNENNTMNEGDTLEWYYAPYSYDQYWNVEVAKTNATYYLGINVL